MEYPYRLVAPKGLSFCGQDNNKEGGIFLCVACFGTRCEVLGVKRKRRNTENVYYRVYAVTEIITKRNGN
jgi:uncharacterized UBP type Zn finger protein